MASSWLGIQRGPGAPQNRTFNLHCPCAGITDKTPTELSTKRAGLRSRGGCFHAFLFVTDICNVQDPHVMRVSAMMHNFTLCATSLNTKRSVGQKTIRTTIGLCGNGLYPKRIASLFYLGFLCLLRL
jgi:hypothetical protein